MTTLQPRMENPVMLLPDVLKAAYSLGAAAKKGNVPQKTLLLVQLRASQINGCSFCVDMHARELREARETDERLFAVAAWRESPYFNDAERAALDLTEAATRLGRARKVFRSAGAQLELDHPSDLPNRLEAVYEAIYLLFNEGYHGSQSEMTVREDLCFEAIRLALLLTENPKTQTPKTYALISLLCFHAARLAGRIDDDGSLVQLEMQDRSKWDRDLITRGFQFFEKASQGNEFSDYHLEAAIASVHCAAATYEETQWSRIVELYDLLYRLKPSPIVALNRAVALGKALGPEEGLKELRTLHDSEKLKQYPFYPAAMGEFELLAGRPAEAAKHFKEALKLGRTKSERNFFQSKLRSCSAGAVHHSIPATNTRRG